MRKTSVEVEFVISGDDFEIDEITKKLNIRPSKFWKLKEDVKGTFKREKCTMWLYSTGKNETLDIYTELKKIQDIFAPKVDVLCKIKEKYKLDYCLDIVIIIENGETPAIYLENSIINFISKIGGIIDMDTYVN